MNEERTRLLSPIGGAVAAICFFMPWVGCMGQQHSGADLGGSLWLVFFSAVGTVGLFFHFRSKDELPKARTPIIICATIGIAIMLLKYFSLLASEYSEMFKLKFGSVATLLGLAVAIYGTSHLSQESRQPGMQRVEGSQEGLGATKPLP